MRGNGAAIAIAIAIATNRAAFVTSLKYLDYQLIEPHHFQKAADAYMEQLYELQQKDKVVEAELREEKKEGERKALLAEVCAITCPQRN